MNINLLCSLCFHLFLFYSAYHLSIFSDGHLGLFQGCPLWKYWTNSPTKCLASPSSSPKFTTLFFCFYSAGQDKLRQGAGSWRSCGFKRPFLFWTEDKKRSSSFVLLIIYQSLTRRADIFVNNKSFAQERDCFLILGLWDSPVGPSEFIAKFRADPFWGLDFPKRSV